jgi:hypothetical protein
MRKSRLRYPQAKDIALVIHALRARVPMDAEVETEWRESDKSVPNLRVKASTQEVPWQVDIYSGHYYVARVGGYPSEVLNSIPSLVLYVLRILRVRPKSQ